MASQLEISNGHAARMRYSRFKQQMQIMEGITPVTRTNRPRKNGAKGDKGSTKTDGQSLKHSGSPPPVVPKLEPGMGSSNYGKGSPFDSNPFIKHEPCMQEIPSLADIPHAVSAPHMMPMHVHGVSGPMIQYPPVTTVAPTDLTLQNPMNGFHHPVYNFDSHQGHHSQHVWAPVKMEQSDNGCLKDVLVKVEQ